MADKVIQLSVKVNSDTGQLDVLGAKFQETGKKAKSAQDDLAGLGKEAKNLFSSFLPFATAGGIVAFFTSAVRGAEEENQALRRLANTLRAHNQEVGEGTQQIMAFAAAIQRSTRFSDTEAFNAIDRLMRVTGNLAQSQKAAALAMDLSTTSGESLEASTQLVTDLLNGNERALRQVRNEYGSFAGSARTAQDALDQLSTNLSGAAERESGLTKETLSLKNQWNDFTDVIGNALSGPLSHVIGWAKEGIIWIDKLGTVFATNAAIIFEVAAGISKALKAAFHLDFDGVKNATKEAMDGIAVIVTESGAMIQAADQQVTDTAALETAKRERLRARESDAERERREKALADAEAAAQKIEAISLDLDARLASIGENTLAKKQAMLNAEINAQRAKITREVQNENERAKLMDKLKLYEAKRTEEITKAEVKLKTDAAFQVAGDSIQALQILNDMQEGHSKEESRRAKLLLALEKSLAIAALWRAEAGKGLAGIAMAASGTALIVAQFAQQSRAIDQARSASEQGKSDLRVSTDLPGGSHLDEIFNGAGSGVAAGGASSAGGAISGAAGAGGGVAYTVIIQPGAIQINPSFESIDLTNARTILRLLGDEVSRGSVEAIRAALQFKRVADQNSGLAV
jgi:hypothetical protein